MTQVQPGPPESQVVLCREEKNNKSSRDFRQLLHNDVSKLEATQLTSLEALLRSLFTSYHKSSCQKIEEQKTRGTGQALKPHVKDGNNTRKPHC
jgi:hypothetical protein